MKLQEELNLLKERITELEHHAKQEQEFPQDGDEYYALTGTGSIVEYIWADDSVDSKSQTMGNMFRTEEEAEFVVEKLKVEAELRKFSKNPSVSGVNWFIVCSKSEEVYTSYTIQEISQGVIYFENKKVAQQAVESVGEERIKKYIFGVED